MPISSAGHLPHINSTSYPALVSHLVSNYNAQRVSTWFVSIRILRSHYENARETSSRPKLMYLINLSEFPSDTFVLIEDTEMETRASIKARLAAQRQQDILMDSDALLNPTQSSLAPSEDLSQLKASVRSLTSTTHTLFTASSQFPLLLSRLNLPPPLGAASTGDGVTPTTATTAAGPGAWLPRGSPILIEGATYDLPSATRYGVEEIPSDMNGEWRIRLGMLQSGGSRTSGAIVENEYLPLLHLDDPMLLLSHLQNLFPQYLLIASQNTSAQPVSGLALHYPSAEQWEEVIPASTNAWVDTLDSPQLVNPVSWRGTERGRRLSYLYIMLLRSQGIL